MKYVRLLIENFLMPAKIQGPPKRKKRRREGAPDYMVTYGDVVTLLLTFFVILLSSSSVNVEELRLILAAFPGLGQLYGGNTLERGRLAELGNTIEALPSQEYGRALDNAVRTARSIFEPEIASDQVRLTYDERGLVISLAGDVYFESSSAELNIEASRVILQKLAQVLGLPDLENNTFRIEGHTDSVPTDPSGAWPSNWHLSSGRGLTVLSYLIELGVSEKKMQVMGLSDTQPFYNNDTPEGRAYNRRVDIVVLSDGHL